MIGVTIGFSFVVNVLWGDLLLNHIEFWHKMTGPELLP